ncbi:efflux RND transporter permease subunit, partial [Bradyrhizobium algeriense]
FTIMGGLFVATFLTLLFLPALYALWFRKHLDERGSEAVVAEGPSPGQAGEMERQPALSVAAE